MTKKRSSSFKDTQRTQTRYLQFLENGHGEEVVNDGWMRVSSMESGAAESVEPRTACPHIPLTEPPAYERATSKRTAGGERLRNKCQRHIQAWTDGLTYQVADVTKPLNSVSKMCDAGNVVTFTAQGDIMKNFVDGRFDALRT